MPFRRWLPNVLLALAVAISLKTFPASADDNPCVPLHVSVDKLQDDSTLLFIRILEGSKRAFAAQVYNDVPPQSDIPWPQAWLAFRNDGYAILMVGAFGAVCGHMMMGPEGLARLLKEIDGQAV